MNYPTFEAFLEEKHMEDYHGSKDGWEDSFDNFLSNLDVQEYIDYAEEYGKKIFDTYAPKKLQVHSGSTTTHFKAEFVPSLEEMMEYAAEKAAKHGEERVSAND
jgi:hypothetical protein